MKMKKIIMSALLTLGVLTASAQAQQQGTTEYTFAPHWYVQVQPVGAQYTLGEVDFSDLLSYNVQAALGYNFSKIFGARLAVNAWQSKAGICNDEFRLVADPSFNESWKWKYVAPSVDLTVNLTNLAGFNPKRFFNLTAFVGVGANIGFSNDDAAGVKGRYAQFCNFNGNQNMDYLWDGTKARIFGQGGLIGDFRLSDAVSLNLEVNANTLNDKYNSKKAGNADWYFNGLVGLKINLGKTYKETFIPAPEPEIRYVEKVVEKIVEKPVPTPIVEEKVAPLRRDIFFLINSTKIRQSEMQKVKDIADYLQTYPNAKVVMTGYADKGTGNASINARLAAKRAEVVSNTLMKQYGIAADRITYSSKGDTEQPFAQNDQNRVTICIAE